MNKRPVCIDAKDPWLSCPNQWTKSKPQETSGGIFPTERCNGCGQSRFCIEVDQTAFANLSNMVGNSDACPEAYALQAKGEPDVTSFEMPELWSVWEHYRGIQYTVVMECRLEATDEPAIAYRKAEDSSQPCWVRSLKDWHAHVGNGVRRFQLVRPA